MKKKILIVEDDASLMLGLRDALAAEGYEVLSAHTGPKGLDLAKSNHPDLLILDLMLPGMSGFEICKRLRDEQFTMPVIMLTSKSDENDKVLGLEIGADDYMTKPFGLRELLARVRGHLRRGAIPTNGDSAAKPERYTFGEIEVNLKRHEVYRCGKRLKLTHREFSLLEYLIMHPGELLTRDRLLDEIWGYESFPTTRTVDNHILRLRRHIEPRSDSARYIRTIHGAGYMFEAE